MTIYHHNIIDNMALPRRHRPMPMESYWDWLPAEIQTYIWCLSPWKKVHTELLEVASVKRSRIDNAGWIDRWWRDWRSWIIMYQCEKIDERNYSWIKYWRPCAGYQCVYCGKVATPKYMTYHGDLKKYGPYLCKKNCISEFNNLFRKNL